METYDDWYYVELLDLMKQKDKDNNEEFYKQIELELPLQYEDPPVVVKKEEAERGVIIIDT